MLWIVTRSDTCIASGTPAFGLSALPPRAAGRSDAVPYFSWISVTHD